MLVCEIKTNRELTNEYIDSDEIGKGLRLQDAITHYLNSKPGSWNLKTVSNDDVTYSFFWSVPDEQFSGKKNGRK